MKMGTTLILVGGAALAYHFYKQASAAGLLRVSVRSIRHSRTNLTQTKFLVGLVVYNPTDTALDFQRVYAQVFTGGQFLGDLDITGSGDIKPRGETTLEVPFLIENFSGVSTIVNLIKTISSGGKLTQPFDLKGELKASGITAAFNASVKLSDLGVGQVAGTTDCLPCLM